MTADARFYVCAACGQDLREAAPFDCGNPWSHDIDVRPTDGGLPPHRPTTTAGASGLGEAPSGDPQAHLPRTGIGTVSVTDQDTIALIAAALLVNHTDDHNQRLGHYTQHIHADEDCTLCRLLRRMALVNVVVN